LFATTVSSGTIKSSIDFDNICFVVLGRAVINASLVASKIGDSMLDNISSELIAELFSDNEELLDCGSEVLDQLVEEVVSSSGSSLSLGLPVSKIVEQFFLISSLKGEGASAVGPASLVDDLIGQEVEALSSFIDVAAVVHFGVFVKVDFSLEDGDNDGAEVKGDLGEEVVNSADDGASIVVPVVHEGFFFGALKSKEVIDDTVDLVGINIESRKTHGGSNNVFVVDGVSGGNSGEGKKDGNVFHQIE